ncbi:MAG: efflux RND transporter periplasmic adaptor subunit [Deltaproteobacteria bacterium]|nr:efflux RND transporter periplasmic adaptor subunit [Deltaproteobacteria bacterium]
MNSVFRYFAIMGLLAVIVGCGIENASAGNVGKKDNTKATANSDDNRETVVRVQKLAAVPFARQIEVTGKALAKQESTLSLSVSGMVKEIPVKRGDRVKKGDVLLKLDRLGYQLGIEQAEAALAGAVAQQELMRTETARLNQLLAEGAAPSASKDELTAQRRGVDAQVDASQTALKRAQKALKDSVLRAPYDSVVSDILIELGEQAHAMPPTMLMTVVDADTLEVQVYVPEEAASQVHAGDMAKVTIDSAGVVVLGRIIFVSDIISQGARTFEARIELDNKDHRIKAGAFARVTLQHEVSGETVFAPVDAIQRDKNNKPYVFVAKKNAAVQRFVKLGVVEGARVQIEDGVNAGDEIIVQGPGTLEDGQKISVKKN